MRIGLGLSIVGQQVAQAPSFTGLLDTYSGAEAAYSVRRLSGSYSGSAIRVRESSGGTEADIGFDGENLDETALLAHCGANDGFVTKWYDQSGNGNDAIQATAGSQPKIVSAGTVVKENGFPTLDFISGNTCFLIATSFDGQSIITSTSALISVSTPRGVEDTNAQIVLNVRGSVSNAIGSGYRGNEARAGLYDGSSYAHLSSISATNNTQYIHFLHNDPVSIFDYYQNSTLATGSNAIQLTLATQSVAIGADLSAFEYDGTIQEIIIYPSDQSANRTGIEGNINSYFSVYP